MDLQLEILASLRTELELGQLPGIIAHQEMSVANRPGLPVPNRTFTLNAAVLLALYPRFDDLHIVLMKRRERPQDRHSGQISFPGGKQEDGESLLQTALRESHEEVGTPLHDVEIIGELSYLHVPVSNFDIYPFVGFMPERPDFTPEAAEVELVLEVPVAHLMHPATKQYRDMNLPSGLILKDVPYFAYEGHTIWGATAMILNEFLSVVKRLV